MGQKKIKFKNRDGKSLDAIIDLPINSNPRAYAIFAHCFTCNKNFKAVTNISKGLQEKGIAVLKFDFTGLGDSEGEFANTNFSTNISDLIDASNYLSTHFKAPELLVGHSLGGAAVLVAGAKIASVKTVATIGAPSDAVHVQHLLNEKIDEIKEYGSASVNIGGRTFEIKQQFLNDIKENKLKDAMPIFRKALLIMHSPQDKIVEINNAKELYQLAHHPKSFVSLDGADHLLTNTEDSLYTGKLIGMWAARYINDPINQEIEPGVVLSKNEGSYTTLLQVRNHEIITDEPLDLGGNDEGPTPGELLKGSLGACTAITLEMYAKRKKWPVESIEVKVASSTENDKTIFVRSLHIKGTLSSDQLDRMMQIANKCPVHKTLEGQVVVETNLIDQ
jgi:putative redox protein